MSTDLDDGLDHERCLELIGEHVNGQLEAHTSRRVQAHIAQCSACFEAHREALEVKEALEQPDPALEALLQTPRREANLERLLASIDATPAAADAAPADWWRRLQEWALLPRGFRVAFAMQSLALVVCLVALLADFGKPDARPAPALYRTFAEPRDTAVPTDAPRYRVVFEAGAAEGDIRALMVALDAQVVGGPSVAGAYTIAPNAGGAAPDLLARLRSSEWIRFAEMASH